MKGEPAIRKAELGDAEEISRLALELGYGTSYIDIKNRLMTLCGSERHLIAVAAIDESSLVGWIAAEVRLILESGERLELVGLVVDARVRRKGVGRALVETVEGWAKELGLSRVVVRSNIVRPESHRFFETIGYAKQKTQHSYSKKLANA